MQAYQQPEKLCQNSSAKGTHFLSFFRDYGSAGPVAALEVNQSCNYTSFLL